MQQPEIATLTSTPKERARISVCKSRAHSQSSTSFPSSRASLGRSGLASEMQTYPGNSPRLMIQTLLPTLEMPLQSPLSLKRPTVPPGLVRPVLGISQVIMQTLRDPLARRYNHCDRRESHLCDPPVPAGKQRTPNDCSRSTPGSRYSLRTYLQVRHLQYRQTPSRYSLCREAQGNRTLLICQSSMLHVRLETRPQYCHGWRMEKRAV